MKRARQKNRAMLARIALIELADECERYRKEAGQLRLAGMVLIKYLERLAAGKTVGTLQGAEISRAAQTIRFSASKSAPEEKA